MRRTTAAPALICLALLVGATGCGGEEPPAAEPSGSPSTPGGSDASSPSSSSSSSPSASSSGTPSASASASASTPPFTGDLRPDDGGPGEGNGLGVTGVRVGRQDGFDRVVFDLGGTGTPGWRVSYVARPVQDGSGDPVRIAGSAYLQVDLRGLGMPSDTGVPEFGDSTTRVRGTGGIAEVAPGSVFEGQQQAFIGLTGSRRPFRVFALTGPTRVVVDVRS
ncbi:hypothetical protein ASG49_07205 [Marmoricola sp. Leaf446]|uniref:AMIN-like domain-containing (lipo)protein n=1 Tax=Marmoricola sp. Leaf446 TaxID=1736379 RepID=UPI0006F3B25C|nr:hypothetical protein [Marmoricola sp. Leaf446]KQT94623.1 hypothetical protein ASG49_07205 [Marmoricola sp. Leaf446]